MMLPSRKYVSDHTKFIRDLIAKKPHLEIAQKKARAIWWDKRPRDVAQRREMDEARVPQKPYVYEDND